LEVGRLASVRSSFLSDSWASCHDDDDDDDGDISRNSASDAVDVKRSQRRSTFAAGDARIVKFLSPRQSADFDQESAVSPRQASRHSYIR